MSENHLCDSFRCSCYVRGYESANKNLIRIINRELDIIESNPDITGFFHGEEMEELRKRLVKMFKEKIND